MRFSGRQIFAMFGMGLFLLNTVLFDIQTGYISGIWLITLFMFLDGGYK